MKIIYLVLLSFIGHTVAAQENSFDGHTWEAPYHLPIPKDWTIERFPIPISFAPEISYQGIEDIRFSPGWGNAGSDEYWAYAFLWYLDGKVAMDVKSVNANLERYYTGLVKINGGEIPNDKRIPVTTSFKEVKKENRDVKTFAGTVTMNDYMSHKPITLNCKVHVRMCEGRDKTFVFYELSPQSFGNIVWKNLGQLWQTFNCRKD